MKCLTTIMAVVAATTIASAEQPPADQGNQTVQIEDLRTPASPAFVLLDVAPASVERPENPKALIVNLVSTASQSEGFPKNYALEVAPYWLKSHPDLTFTEYQQPSVIQSLLRTAAISVATTPLLDPADAEPKTIGSRLGFGIRANLVGGRPNPRMSANLEQLDKINRQILDELERPVPDKGVIQKLTAEVSKLALSIQGLDQQRVGLFVTAAAGQVWNFPSDVVNRRERDRWGVWVTPAYRLLACGTAKNNTGTCKSVIDLIGVVRATADRGQDQQWDYGARLLWEPTALFTISGEFLWRRATDSDEPSSDRTVAVLEYRIREDLLLFGSFGKNFEDDDTRRTLVSVLGVSFGFGTKPTARTR